MDVTVFVCTCHGRINIDRDAIKKMLSEAGLGEPVFIEEACTPHAIKKMAQGNGHGDKPKILIGACNPPETWRLVSRVLEKEGINPNDILVVDTITEALSSRGDTDRATERVYRLLRAAAPILSARKPIPKRSIETHDKTLVVGAGIAGLFASLFLARQQKRVVLIDKSPSMGGRALDPEWDALTPLENRSLAHQLATLAELDENVTFIPGATIKGFKGGPGKYNILVQKEPTRVDWEKCDNCGACIPVCPRGFIGYHHENSHPRKPLIKGDVDYCMKVCEKPCISACAKNAIKLDEKQEYPVVEAAALILATGLVYPEETGDRLPTIWSLSKTLSSLGQESKTLAIIVPPREALGGQENLVWESIALLVNKWIETRRDPRVFLFSPDKPASSPAIDKALAKKNVTLVRALPQETDHEKRELRVATPTGSIPIGFDVLGVAAPPYMDTETRAILDLFGTPCKTSTPSTETGTITEPDREHPPVYSCGLLSGNATLAGIAESARACTESAGSWTGSKISIVDTTPRVDDTACSGCGACVWHCPMNAITIDKKEGVAVIDPDACNACGACISACPTRALRDPLLPQEGMEGLAEALSQKQGTILVLATPEVSRHASEHFQEHGKPDNLVMFTVSSPLYPGAVLAHEAISKGIDRVVVLWWPPDPRTGLDAKTALSRARMYNEISEFLGLETDRLVALAKEPRESLETISRLATTRETRDKGAGGAG